MYKVTRSGGRTVIKDWNGSVVFSTDDDALVMYREQGLILTAKVGELTDIDLLTALASSVKLAL